MSKFRFLKKQYLTDNKKLESVFGNIEDDLKEEFDGKKLDEIFSLSYFNFCLSQKGIDKYNTIIGGKKLENEIRKRQGVNESINLFSQNPEKYIRGEVQDRNTVKKGIKRLKMESLFKQILSDRESSSFVLDKFEDDKDVINSLNRFYKGICGGNAKEETNVFEQIREILSKLDEYYLENIYVKNKNSIRHLSKYLYGFYDSLTDALKCYAEKKLFPFKKKEIPTKKELKQIEDWIKKTPCFSIKQLQESIELYSKFFDKRAEGTVLSYFSDFKKHSGEQKKDILEEVQKKYEEVKNILDEDQIDGKKILIEKEDYIERIKAFLDSIFDVFNFIKPFQVSAEDKDGNFYSEFETIFERLEKIIPLYNKVRNYITQKPYSTEKFKLNFENSTLAKGWDLNKEKKNTTVLFKKHDLFYVGVMDKDHRKILENPPFSKENDSYYEKIVYKLLPGANKMLPKVFFSKKHLDYYSPSEEIIRIRNHSTYTKNGDPQEGYEKKDFILNDCHKMIDFFKKQIEKHPEWRNYNFKFSKTTSYGYIDEFYREVEIQGYKIDFKRIDEEYIEELINEGKLYLFKIWNKDFSKYSKGKKNLHTLYWNAVFDEKNLNDVVYKLNGEAELFYRKKSIDKKITHLKNLTIDNKDPIDDKKESKFSYDIIKDRRFTKAKFMFHCPITLNFKAKANLKMNDKVNYHIKENLENVHILSIDRGERHLAYYTLLDNKGVIVDQGSFNNIRDVHGRETKYRDKLDKSEGDRDKARKSWKKIKNIKELKEGYLSQVVHKIAKMVIEKNAIVIFEDLNFGFKRGRFKIEKQVYQKFERRLIEKLNYLVFKDREYDEKGGVLNAYQLTQQFESFQKLGKQTGIIFYVSAHYTSKVCPKTGFVNLLYPKHVNIKESKNFFNKFIGIQYNTQENYFEFIFNYKDFKTNNSFNKIWTVCSYGKRLKNVKDKNGHFKTEEINITKEIKQLFEKHGIIYSSGDDIKKEISEINNGAFFKELIDYLKLVLQMRNSVIGKQEDYFFSCVKDKDGMFFNSKEAKINEPKDADANGAYNIGLKGVMLLEKIKSQEEKKKLNLTMKNEEFFKFVLSRVD